MPVPLDGFCVPASVRLLYHVPLIGYLLNMVVAMARLPNSLRHEQQFQAHVLAQQEIITEHANHLAETIGIFGNEIARSISRSIQELTEKQRQQIEAVSGEQNAIGDELRKRLTQTNEVFHETLVLRQNEMLARLSELNDHFEQTIRQAIAVERDSVESRLTRLNRQFESILTSEQTARERDFD